MTYAAMTMARSPNAHKGVRGMRACMYLALVSSLMMGCQSRSESTPSAPVVDAPPSVTASAAPSAPSPPASSERYLRSMVQTVADGCSPAYVVIMDAPASLAAGDFGWPFVKHALLANPEFEVVSSEPPTRAGQIGFRAYETAGKGGPRTLLASCVDGATCNRLAAMLKAVIRSRAPQPYCGKVPDSYSAPTEPTKLVRGVLDRRMPHGNDPTGKCVRLAACGIRRDPTAPGDPILECTKSPASFKLACAEKPSCDEVTACLAQ